MVEVALYGRSFKCTFVHAEYLFAMPLFAFCCFSFSFVFLLTTQINQYMEIDSFNNICVPVYRALMDQVDFVVLFTVFLQSVLLYFRIEVQNIMFIDVLLMQ